MFAGKLRIAAPQPANRLGIVANGSGGGSGAGTDHRERPRSREQHDGPVAGFRTKDRGSDDPSPRLPRQRWLGSKPASAGEPPNSRTGGGVWRAPTPFTRLARGLRKKAVARAFSPVSAPRCSMSLRVRQEFS